MKYMHLFLALYINCALLQANTDSTIKNLLQKPLTAENVNDLGQQYFNMKDYSKAEYYFNMLYDEANKNNDALLLSKSLNNLGIIQYQKNNLNDAIYLFERSLNIKLKHNLTRLESAYSNIGICYEKKGIYNNAIKYYRKALLNSKTEKDSSTIFLNLGRAFLNLNTDSSFYYHQRAIKMGKGLEHHRLSVLNLAEYYSSVGNHKKSMEYLCKYLEIQNRLYNAQLIEKTAEIEKEFLQQKEQIQSKHNRVLALITGSLSGGFALILLFAAAGKFYRNTKFTLPRLLLSEKLKVLFSEKGKLILLNYQKPMPEPLELKMYELIKYIVNQSKSEHIFCNVECDGLKMNITLNIKNTNINKDVLIAAEKMASEFKAKFRYQTKNDKLNCLIAFER